MKFSKSSDEQMARELVNNSVIRTGLDGLQVSERLGLIDNLILNESLINADRWLEWLTTKRFVFRVANLAIDAEWLASRRLSNSIRQMCADEWVMPLYVSAGTVLCSSLNGTKDMISRWSEILGAPVLMAGPTLKELGEIKKFYHLN